MVENSYSEIKVGSDFCFMFDLDLLYNGDIFVIDVL